MLRLLLLISLIPALAFAEGGGTGAGNGGGSMAVSRGMHLAQGSGNFLRKMRRTFDFAGVAADNQCAGFKDLPFPSLPPGFERLFDLRDENGKKIDKKWICQSQKSLQAHRSLLNAMIYLHEDPIYQKVVSEILKAKPSPILIHLADDSRNVRYDGGELKEQAWIDSHSGAIGWGPPLFSDEEDKENSEISSTLDLFGRWEAPLLMHELGHVLARRLNADVGNCVHDLRPLKLDPLQKTFEPYTPDSFFSMHTDQKSAFYESFSNMLETPYLLTHPMIYEGAGLSLENHSAIESRSFDELTSNEAFLSTVGWQFLLRPFRDSHLSERPTHAADLLVPRGVNSKVLSQWIDALIAIGAKADWVALCNKYDEKWSGMEGARVLASFFRMNINGSPISEFPKNLSYAHWIKKQLEALQNQRPRAVVNETERTYWSNQLTRLHDYYVGAFSKFEKRARTAAGNVTIQDVVRSEKFRALTIIEIGEALDQLRTSTFAQNQLKSCADLHAQLARITSQGELDALRLRELEPFLKTQTALIELFVWLRN